MTRLDFTPAEPSSDTPPGARRPSRDARRALRAMVACAVLAPACAFAFDVKLLFVGDPEGPTQRGARQGLAEAQAQGEFLGQRYTLETLPAAPAAADGVSAIVVDLPAAGIRDIAQRFPTVPVLNAGSEEDALRADCLPNLLHTLPSAAMRADAVAQWRQLHPDVAIEARAWHPDFEKYAASQLNSRYRERFGEPMDDRAWAGWAAVKLVSDTVAREQTGEPATILEALRTKLAFDGQKGADLRFRENGQLGQPLLLVAEDGKLLGEAPVRGVADIEDLDSLGVGACGK